MRRRGILAGAIAAVVLIAAAVVAAVLLLRGSTHPAEASTLGSRLEAIALKVGDRFNVAGTRVACAVSRDRGAVWIDCWNFAAGPGRPIVPRSYGVSISSHEVQIERFDAAATRVLRRLRQPPRTRTITVPVPARAVQAGPVALGLILPVGGSEVACATQPVAGVRSVLCGVLSHVSLTADRVAVRFPPRSYGIVINGHAAEVVRWIDLADDYRTVVSKRQPG